MAYTAAALDDVIPFGVRGFSFGNYRRLFLGGVAVAVGTVAAGWVMTTSLKVVTAWTAAAYHGTSHAIQVRPPFATPEAMALANPYGTLASALFGSARAVNVPASDPVVSFESKWAGVMAQAFAPTGSAPVLSDRSFGPVVSLTSPLSYPLPLAVAANPSDQTPPAVAGATREAELSPPAAAMSASGIDVPLPPKRILESANGAPSSGPDQNARPPAGPAAPQVATVSPPPASSSGGPFSFFAKLFAPHQGDDNSNLLPGRDSRTAVYDIEAHTVYLPNGDRLEAHSGMGEWLDDPRSVNVKNRGATPPHVYNLVLRESLFHGVQAIRLNPVGDGNMFGRDGILAHSYMLGPNGQSNGCVSFRDYQAFLRAFLKGEFDRIVVVPRLGATPLRTARPSRSHDRYALNSR